MFNKENWINIGRLSFIGLLLSLVTTSDASAQLEVDIGLVDAREYVNSACPQDWHSMYSRIQYSVFFQNNEKVFPDIWNGSSNDKALYMSYAYLKLLPASQQTGGSLTLDLSIHDSAVIAACAAERRAMFKILERNANDNMGGDNGFDQGLVIDDDSDGVFNLYNACPENVITCGVVDDQCQDTPAGEPVDLSGVWRGCSITQKDSDYDGITDDLDILCTSTPVGEAVDPSGDWLGCSISEKDTDGDGVFDDVDQCEGTPIGIDSGADGCPADTDDDGLFDYEDPYPLQSSTQCFP